MLLELDRVAQLEMHYRRGTAPPRHIHHREDETIFVLYGDVTAFVGNDEFTLSPGGFVLMPQGIEHTFLVRYEEARLLVTIAPAGFERFFAELGAPVAPGEPEPAPVIPDLVTFAKRSAPYGVEIVGPPPVIEAAV